HVTLGAHLFKLRFAEEPNSRLCGERVSTVTTWCVNAQSLQLKESPSGLEMLWIQKT
ncbi:hypothetical protein ABEB36_002787, partial [Hypothenemus hampei]